MEDIGEACEKALTKAMERNAEFLYIGMHPAHVQDALKSFWKAGWLDGYISAMNTARGIFEGSKSPAKAASTPEGA